MTDITQCSCGIPNSANWHTHVILTRMGETTYSDIYTCDDHFPGYPDGSMSMPELLGMFQFDNPGMWYVLEFESTHLR